LQSGIPSGLLDGIIAEFNKQYPNINIIVDETLAFGYFDTTIPTDANTNSIDLYLMCSANIMNIITMNEGFLADLSPVVDAKLDGHSKTIRERLNSRYAEIFTMEDGSIYTLPWQSQAHGMVYNKKWFDDNGFVMASTTDELIELCDAIAEKGEKAFIGSNTQYWCYLYEGWWAQYQGVEEYFNFYSATDALGTQPSNKVWAQQGRLEALEVLEDIFSFNSDNTYKYVVPGSNTMTHTEAQTKFLNGVGKMMANASWLEAEMAAHWKDGQDIRMSKLPVVSSIIEVLPDKSVQNDAQLREVIAYIDAVAEGEDATKPSYVSDVDLARLVEARNVVYTTQQMNVAIPSYSKAKDAAMNFLKVMYSDTGLKELANKLLTLPGVTFDNEVNKPDTSKWSTFANSAIKLQETANYVYNPLNYPLFYKNGLTAFNSVPEFSIGATNPNDRKSAYEFWEYDQAIVKSYWKNYLSAAGLED